MDKNLNPKKWNFQQYDDNSTYEYDLSLWIKGEYVLSSLSYPYKNNWRLAKMNILYPPKNSYEYLVLDDEIFTGDIEEMDSFLNSKFREEKIEKIIKNE